MQLNFGKVDVPGIAEPGLVEQWVLSNPWPLTLVLLGMGVGGFLVLARLGRPARQGLAVLVTGVILGVVVAGVGTFVTTDREVIMERTRELVERAVKADGAGIGEILGEQAQLRGIGRQAIGRERLLSLINSDMRGRYEVKEHRVRTLRGVIDPVGGALTQVEVVVTPAQFGFPIGSWWQIRWQKDGAGVFRVLSIECQQIDGVKNPGSIGL